MQLNYEKAYKKALDEVRKSVRAFARKRKAHKTLAAIDRNEPSQEIIKIALDELTVVDVVAAIDMSERWDWEHGERSFDFPDLNAHQCQKLTDAIHILPSRDAAVMWAYRALKDVASLNAEQRKVLFDIIIESKWDMILRDALEWLPRVTVAERTRVETALAALPPESDD